MIYHRHSAISRYFLECTPRLVQEKWMRCAEGYFVVVVFLFNEYIITSMLPLHIPGQQLMVKFENNYEG